jgi:tetratricopeptide (TPR) repeat protein
MISSAKTLLLAIAVGCVSFAQTTTAPATSKNPADATKASAYYNFAMGRLYSELAGAEGSREYVDKAIQYYRDALKADPTASIIAEELTDLYVSIGRLSDALSLAEDLLKQNPDSLDTRRMLGRIYTRALANGPDVKADDPSLRKAI